MKEKSRVLLDSWNESGTGLDGFEEVINALVKRTEIVKVSPSSLNTVKYDGVYHAVNYDGENGELKTICCNPGNTGKVATISNINKDEEVDSEAVMNELLLSAALCMRLDKKTYFFSQEAFFTLKERLGFKDAINDLSEERDIFIARLMSKFDEGWKLCVRTDGHGKGEIKKVFAAFTDKYKAIPQTVIVSIIKKILETDLLGKPEAAAWKVSQTQTEFICEFPEQAEAIQDVYGISDLIPCIRILSGDTGKQSLTFHACWKRKGHFIIQDDLLIKHLGRKCELENIYNEVMEKIFPAFTLYPDLLVQMMNITVFDGTDSSVKTSKHMEVAEEFVKYCFKKIGLVKAIGKENEMKVRELLLGRIDYKAEVTCYDIISLIMDIPYLLRGISDRYKTAMEKACGLAPTIDVNGYFGGKGTGDDLYMV